MDSRYRQKQAGEKRNEDRALDIQSLWSRGWTAYLARDLVSAESACNELLKCDPRHVQGRCLLAEIYRSTGRLNDAIRQLEQTTQGSPEEAQPHYSLGLIWLNQGEATKAARCFREALQCRPEFAEAYASLGSACYRDGLLDEAIDLVRRELLLHVLDASDTQAVVDGIRREFEPALIVLFGAEVS